MSLHVEVTDDLAACHALRHAVFITEQQISVADEMDDLDDEAMHILAKRDGRPVGTARILLRGETGKIGRVCVLADQRGTGSGAALMREAIAVLRAMPEITQVKLSSQDTAMGFYARLGFVAEGDFYDDAGIPHKDMTLKF